MLYLSSNDIEKVINHEEVVEIIESAMLLYETGNFTQPDRITVNRKDKETYLYMPCFTDEVKGTKILTLYAENAQKGIPTIQGVMLLNDVQTGKINCIMEGSTLTAYRTGAVGSCGIKHTTPKNVTTLGIVGTGIQGYYQCLYACKIRNIKQITVFDIFKDKAEEFKKRLENALPNVSIRVADSTEELLSNSEVIVTVTTSPNPVLPNDADLLREKHFIGIGSYKPTMQEYPQALFETVDNIFIDVEFAKEETGDLINPLREGWIKENQIHTLGKYLDKEINVDGTTFYKSVGMALFDITVADYIYNKAKKLGIGIELE
ncbi:MAG TPA: hypothetical protein DC000_11650 [Clostridiales bacterium]|nr:hypothetical protein [Clostridiales bacterium]